MQEQFQFYFPIPYSPLSSPQLFFLIHIYTNSDEKGGRATLTISFQAWVIRVHIQLGYTFQFIWIFLFSQFIDWSQEMQPATIWGS